MGNLLRAALEAQNALLAEQCRLLREVGEWVRSGKALGGNGRVAGAGECGTPPAVRPTVTLRLAGEIAPDEIKPHIESWGTSMKSRGKKPPSIARFRRVVERLCEYNSWRHPSEMTLAGAEAFLMACRAGECCERPWKGPTCDQATSAFRRFGKHLQRHEIRSTNPFELMESSGEGNDVGDRPGMTDEIRRLMREAIVRCAAGKRVRCNAAFYWYMLAYTGLRAWEDLRFLQWCDVFDLDTESPHLWTHPTRTKNKKRMRIPIRASLAVMLREHRQCVPSGPTDRVFPTAPNRATFNVDRSAALVVPKNGDGIFGAHSLRKWLSCELDRVTTAGVRYKIMRHAGNITEDRYTRTDLVDELKAVNALPEVWPETMPVPKVFSYRNEKKGIDPAPRSDTVSLVRPTADSIRADHQPPRSGDAAVGLTNFASRRCARVDGPGMEARQGSSDTPPVSASGYQDGNGQIGSVLGGVSNRGEPSSKEAPNAPQRNVVDPARGADLYPLRQGLQDPAGGNDQRPPHGPALRPGVCGGASAGEPGCAGQGDAGIDQGRAGAGQRHPEHADSPRCDGEAGSVLGVREGREGGRAPRRLLGGEEAGRGVALPLVPHEAAPQAAGESHLTPRPASPPAGQNSANPITTCDVGASASRVSVSPEDGELSSHDTGSESTAGARRELGRSVDGNVGWFGVTPRRDGASDEHGAAGHARISGLTTENAAGPARPSSYPAPPPPAPGAAAVPVGGRVQEWNQRSSTTGASAEAAAEAGTSQTIPRCVTPTVPTEPGFAATAAARAGCPGDSASAGPSHTLENLSRAQLARDVNETHQKYLALIAALLALLALLCLRLPTFRDQQLAAVYAGAEEYRGT